MKEMRQEVGIGMLGYAFMGRAHSNALRSIPFASSPPPAQPRLVAVCGRHETALRQMAQRYGYEKTYTDWRDMLQDDQLDVIMIGGPNDIHAQPAIAAARAGKHVFCEKPLARSGQEAFDMLTAVRESGVQHGVAFNYRFVPAIQLAKQLITRGELGRICHFRAVYLQDWLLPHHNTPHTWRLDKAHAGSGALGDLGAHIIDLGRYLVGEMAGVTALTKTFIGERPTSNDTETGKVTVDDAFIAAVEFENGAIGSLESSRMAAGRKNHQVIEINGEKGSIRFNLERLNELQIYRVADEEHGTAGFQTILVTEPQHPWLEHWWPPGHIIGWEHTFIHEWLHFLRSLVSSQSFGPLGATFEDGYRAAVICDAISEAAAQQRHLAISYDDV